MGMNAPATFLEVVEKWPSAVVLASEISTTETTVTPLVVRSWKQRNFIPGEYWAAIADAAAKRGMTEITFERLARLGSKIPKRQSAA